VDGERAGALARAQPVADDLAVDLKGTARAAFVRRPLACGDERAVRDADRRDVEDRAEVERDAGAARMVSACAVDQENVRRLAQRADRGFQQGAFAQREQTRLVGRRGDTRDDCGLTLDEGGSPREIAGGEGDEAAADARFGVGLP
jgi:hypothetical protein